MAVAASVLLVSAVGGVTLWSILPPHVPKRWHWDQVTGLNWVSGTPVEWVDKSLLAVFGPLTSAVLLLAVGMIAIWTGLPRELLVRMRRLLFGQVSAQTEVLELSIHDALWTWLASGVAVATAADSWEMWLLALGLRFAAGTILSDLCAAAMLLGLVLSLLATYLQLKRAARAGVTQ